MKRLLFLALASLAACGGSGGTSATTPSGTPVSECTTTGSFTNSGSGDIIIQQNCINGDGNTVVSCKNEDTQQPVNCDAIGAVVTTVNPTPTP